MDYFVCAVNENLRKAANEYENVYYVDTDGVETILVSEGTSVADPTFGSKLLKAIHPTFAGHMFEKRRKSGAAIQDLKSDESIVREIENRATGHL